MLNKVQQLIVSDQEIWLLFSAQAYSVFNIFRRGPSVVMKTGFCPVPKPPFRSIFKGLQWGAIVEYRSRGGNEITRCETEDDERWEDESAAFNS